jgi:uncharacterized protein with PQ loop repeat
VSNHLSPDDIVIKFKDPLLFKTAEGAIIPEVLQSGIPKQMPNTFGSRSFNKATSGVSSILNFTVLICAIINYLYSGVLVKIVGSLMAVQVVIFEGLMMFLLPGNALNYIGKIRPIVTFNIIKFLTDFSVYFLPIDQD